jgi:hypothetical protein
MGAPFRDEDEGGMSPWFTGQEDDCYGIEQPDAAANQSDDDDRMGEFDWTSALHR